MFIVSWSFESGFTGLRGFERTSSVWVKRLFVDWVPSRCVLTTSGHSPAIFAPPPSPLGHPPPIRFLYATQRRDASRLFRDRSISEIHLYHLVLNQDLQDLQDYRGGLRDNRNGYSWSITFHPSFRRCVTHRRKTLQKKHHLIINFPIKPETLQLIL